jgi:hypothetical protein
MAKLQIHEGARRRGVIANVMMTASLFGMIISWKLSVGLFLGAWVLYGIAWMIDGFGEPTPQTEPESSS